MTTEELKALRDRWADIRFLPSFPASQIEVLNLCAEVERLQKAVAEARAIIEHVGYVSAGDFNVVSKANAWMQEHR